MFLEKLIAPRWKHKNPQVRKRALLSLDPLKDESQRIFLEVLNNDPELFIRRIAIKGLTNISQLQNLRESVEQSEIYQEATGRLCELLATVNKHRPVSYLKNALSGISENRILEYVALHANNEELQFSVLDKVANEAILFEIINSTSFDNNKKHALAKLQSVNSLKRAVKILRRKDKDLALQAQSMLNRIEEKLKQSAELHKEYRRTANEFLELYNLCHFSGEWEKYEHRLRELNDRCRGLATRDGELQAENDLALLAQIDDAFSNFENQLSGSRDLKAQRPDWESSEITQAADARPMELDSLAEILNELIELNSKLTRLQIADWHVEKENIEQQFRRLKNRWTNTDSNIATDHLSQDDKAELEKSMASFSGEEKQFNYNMLQFADADAYISRVAPIKEQAKLLLENKDLPDLVQTNELLSAFENCKKPDNRFVPEVFYAEVAETKSALKQKRQDIENSLEELCSEFSTLISRLEQSLANGKAKNVQQMLNRGRNILRQLPAKFLSKLEKKKMPATFNQLARRADSLLEWRHWSTSAVKEQLIEDMEKLAVETNAHTGDEDYDFSHAASEIRRARTQWTQASKGDVDKEVSLWEKFDAACNHAYQPCQSYFNKLDEQQANNLQQRGVVCSDLEKYFDSVTGQAQEEINWKAMENIVRVAHEEWGKLGEVGHNDRQEINKRFHGILRRLENLVNNHRKENRESKLALISRVEGALKQLEEEKLDLAGAVNAVKNAQAEWKHIGPANKDKQLWKKFRTVCDAVFDVKKAEQEKTRQESANINSQRQAIVDAINRCSAEARDAILQTKAEVEKLQSEWLALPKLKKGDRQEKDFNDACDGFTKKLRQIKRDQLREVKRKIQNNVACCYQLENLVYEHLQGRVGENALAEAVLTTSENWQAINEKSLTFTTAIEERFAELKQTLSSLAAGNRSEVEKILSQQHENRINNKEKLCIQLEILAGKESPEGSRQKRMEIQVAELANRMKQKDMQDVDHKTQLLLSQWHTSGFILPPDSTVFEQRFYSALELLDKDYQYPQ